MFPVSERNILTKNAAERSVKELIERYHQLREELKVARSIFEFERASDLRVEMAVIKDELSKRMEKKVV